MPRDIGAIRRVLWLTLGLNLLVATAKLAYGLQRDLLAMSADGVHSFLDAGNNVIGLVAVAAARRPPDSGHPYGHRKFETFAALSIGALLLLASYEILKAAWGRLFEAGALPRPGAGGVAIMVCAMGISWLISVWERREGERLHSEMLVADSAHTRSDVLTSASVLLTLLAARVGWTILDVIVTFGLVAWIGVLAFQVVKPAVATLADEARLDPDEIDDLAMSVEGVRDVHRIRTRGSLDQVFVDLHLQVDARATIEQGHDIAHEVEDAIRRRYPQVADVLAHVEPHGDPVEGLDGAIVGPPR